MNKRGLPAGSHGEYFSVLVNLYERGKTMAKENVLETDVLVIGGGMAGLFAAIKAREQGVNVTLVDKGYAGKSGQTPGADSYIVFNPDWGHDLNAWMEQVNNAGEYINHREWTEVTFTDSYTRYRDLISWGVEFQKDENGELIKTRTSRGPNECLRLVRRKFTQVIRNQAIKSGVKVLDRIMVVELVKQDGRILGAVGISMDSTTCYVFMAKATVLCTGAGGFKPAGWPISSLTFDGEAMAYRAGAEISGKEFVDTHRTSADYPAAQGRGMRPPGQGVFQPPKIVNAEGNEVTSILGTNFLELEFEAHAGRAPVFNVNDAGDKIPIVGCAAAGMAGHTTEGIWPANMMCASNIPGLYGAGDSLCTMFGGAAGVCPGLLAAAVTGARAGWGAAEYAAQVKEMAIDNAELARVKRLVLEPTQRRGGFGPRWVTQVLQNTMIPYYILYIKHEARMKAALTIVEFLRDHMIPRLVARDPHDLRLAHETRNMILNAELVLKSSLFRTESRGTHYREDYPHRDDPEWLAWVKIKEEQVKMKLYKVPIPKEWWPDLSLPYEERYPARYPGE